MVGRILVVDPVPTNRMVLRAKLSLAHYEVSVVESVAQARAAFAANRYEVVLLCSTLICIRSTAPDCALSWMSDARAAHNMATAFVFMRTGPAADDKMCTLLDRCLRAGASDLLWRPFNEGVLLARIRSLMRDNAAPRDLHIQSAEGDLTPADNGREEGLKTLIFSTEIAPDEAAQPTTLDPSPIDAINQSRQAEDKICAVPLSTLMRPDARPSEPDVVVLLTRTKSVEHALSVMSQMRSRSHMHDVRIILSLQCPSPEQLARAYDLGAHDVVTDSTPIGELAPRIDNQARIARQLQRHKRAVREGLKQAMTDPLTGLHNRRYAAQKLRGMQRTCLSNNTNFAILAFDVDHFKGVNDRYGHAVGDIVLTSLAQTLRQNLRSGDLICRTGGEEFLVALPNAGQDEAAATADRLRKAVGAMDITVKAGLAPLHVTVSIGLSVQDGRVAIPDMLEQADRALYDAKSRGRNVVAIATAA